MRMSVHLRIGRAIALSATLWLSAESQVNAEEVLASVEISDGSRVSMNEKGFSLVPPAGWEVHRDRGVSTLLLQIPSPADGSYQRTIQAMVFPDPLPIDALTAERYAQHIIRKMTEASVAISGYRIRSSAMEKLAGGGQAIAYYAEFEVNGEPLMQLHLLTSSRDRHYLVTYTDVPAHFEGAEAEVFLKEAWSTLSSLEVGSAPPMRYETLFVVGAAVLACFAAFFSWRYWRRKNAVWGAIAAKLDVEEQGGVDEASEELKVVTVEGEAVDGLEEEANDQGEPIGKDLDQWNRVS